MFRNLKSDSSALANRPSCSMELHISVRFEAWKRDYWEINNRPPYRTALPIYDVSQPETRFLSISKTTSLMESTVHIRTFRNLHTRFLSFSKSTLLLSGTAHVWNCRSLKTPFLKINKSTPLQFRTIYVSEFENAFPELHQIDLLAGRTTHIWTIPSLITWFLSISKTKSFHVGTANILTFCNMNTRFLSISKSIL